jgi:hypothetical protein
MEFFSFRAIFVDFSEARDLFGIIFSNSRGLTAKSWNTG